MRKRKLSQRFIIGIDEVGRGCLAGPVAVAALVLPRNFQFSIFNFQKKIKFKIPLRDSKKLSLKQREEWVKFIKQQKIPFSIASVSPKIIDKINISQAANLAATRALQRLIKNYELRIKNCKIFLDGGLYINKNIYVNPRFNLYKSATTTVVRGDEKIPAISLASIVAKVHRDKLMKRLHKKYPHYGFIRNVGYGTKKHIKAIRKFGRSPIHRKSFHTV